jgi:glycosyltransferase involved in cell wall biosynthesis
MTSLSEQRVLILHNRYRLAGGEERYVKQLAELLERRAASVTVLERSSEELGSTGAAAGLLRGGLRPEEVRRAVEESGATIVHAHNVHPSFGWRGLAAARDAGAATVLHLHNYRLFCAIGIAYRDGHDCTECAPDHTSNAFKHNCRGSLPESAAYATGLGRSQAPLIEAVDRFAAPVSQLSDDLDELGFDLPVSVLPTWLPEGDFVTASQAADGEYGLFVGRVAEEKGIFVAIEAAARSGVPLRVAGIGPDIQEAVERAASLDAPVEFLGRIDGQGMVAARMGAAFCVLPSVWREVLPFSALEALASGVPLIVSDRGGLPQLTEPGLVHPAGDANALGAMMRELFDDQARRRSAGDTALALARQRFSEEVFADRLAGVYTDARAARGA